MSGSTASETHADPAGTSVSANHAEEHAIHHWIEELSETEIEATSIAVGFLVAQSACCVSIGRVPSLDCSKSGSCAAPTEDVLSFSALIALSMFVVIVATIYKDQLEVVLIENSPQVSLAPVQEHAEHEQPNSSTSHAVMHENVHPGIWHWIQSVSLMSTGWSLVMAFKLVFTVELPGGYIGTSVVSAFLMSPVIIVVVIILDALADRGLLSSNSAVSAMSVVSVQLGLLWERAFKGSIDAVTEGSDFGQKYPFFLDCIIGLVLMAALLPAWRLYIVPVARLPSPRRYFDSKTKNYARQVMNISSTLRAGQKSVKSTGSTSGGVAPDTTTA